MKKSPTILVADDHPLLLKGLIEELEAKAYQVIGQADNGSKALNLIIELQPDIAILDVEMPLLSGIEVIQKAKENQEGTKFIMLTSHKEHGIIIQAKNLHISGYLLKDEPFEELESCIQAVLRDEMYFSKTFTEVLKEEVNPQLKKIKYLTPSERTILRMIAQGNSSREIALKLSISIRTVEKHRSNIIEKLDLSSYEDSLSFWAQNHKDLILSL